MYKGARPKSGQISCVFNSKTHCDPENFASFRKFTSSAVMNIGFESIVIFPTLRPHI